jgi:hypothetical protein
MQGVSIQMLATIFGDTDGSHLGEVRLLSIVNHVGIGMENTKLLCWMLYTPTRQLFLYTFVHGCFLRLFAATKGLASTFRQLQQMLHVPLFTLVH